MPGLNLPLWLCGDRRRDPCIRHASYPPEEPATEEQQHDQDPELAAADPLMSTVTVVPGEHQCNRQTDHERSGGRPLQGRRPLKDGAEVREALQQAPGCGHVRNAPLHNLATPQPRPQFFLGLLGCLDQYAPLVRWSVFEPIAGTGDHFDGSALAALPSKVAIVDAKAGRSPGVGLFTGLRPCSL